MELSLLHTKLWQPFAQWEYDHPLLEFNGTTIINTWCALLVILLLSVAGRLALKKPDSVAGYIAIQIIKNFKSMIEQSKGFLVTKFFYFIASLFMFIFVCNAIVLIPGLEEPTQDLNTTIGLALISFLYVQKEALLAHGLKGYILEYFKMPFALLPATGFSFTSLPSMLVKLVANLVIGFLSLPLELLGKAANIISLSLRLFGNIFGGAVITSLFKNFTSGSSLMHYLALVKASTNVVITFAIAPFLFGFVMLVALIIALFFGLFESFIQAFVFSVLSLTYLSLGTQTEAHGAHQENLP